MCPHTYVSSTSMCPHTTINLFSFLHVSSYVSSYHYIFVLISIYVSAYSLCVSSFLYMCPHTPARVHPTSVLPNRSRLYMCPHTSIYVSAYLYICVLIPLYMCPHPSIYVSSFLCMCPHTTARVNPTSFLPNRSSASSTNRPRSQATAHSLRLYMCPHTSIYVSSYLDICVLIPLYVCPHTSIYVSPYLYICVLKLVHVSPHTSIHAADFLRRSTTCVLIPLYI